MRVSRFHICTVYTVLCVVMIMAPQAFALTQIVEKNTDTDERGKSQRGSFQPPVILSPVEISEFRDIFQIQCTWSEVPDAARYHVVLAKDRRFKDIIHENTDITDTSYTIGNLDYGSYFLKVSSIASDNAESPFSDILTFIIVPSPPVNVPLDYYW